jgi:hypothetical protein
MRSGGTGRTIKRRTGDAIGGTGIQRDRRTGVECDWDNG